MRIDHAGNKVYWESKAYWLSLLSDGKDLVLVDTYGGGRIPIEGAGGLIVLMDGLGEAMKGIQENQIIEG